MSNRFGHVFTVTSFGESHGPAIGCVIDGCPPGLSLALEDFAADLNRRKTGQSRHTSQRREPDSVEILSGVYGGVTTGTPIALLIRNADARSSDYAELQDRFRPGHADFTYHAKYGIRDPNGGGRASARETTVRVAAGVIAKKWLAQHHGISITAYVSQIGAMTPGTVDPGVAVGNPFNWPDSAQIEALESLMDNVRKSGDSVGGRVDVIATGVPAGLGQPVFGKLDAALAGAMMSINAVKGVEIGAGFAAIAQKGSEHRDPMTPNGFSSNHAGGILGGISTGQDIRCSVAFKPTSSLRLPVDSIDVHGNPVQVQTKGRHDPCVALRAPVICEAMMAMVLIDMALLHRAQCGESKLS